MAGQLREYRGRIRSTRNMQKIFRAMELIATSRITKARAAVAAAAPYSQALTRAVSAVATHTDAEHPLITEHEKPRRAAVLVVTSDRGMAGAYSSGVLREAERVYRTLAERGVEPEIHVAGRKGVAYYKFRRREIAGQWTGHSESPTYEIADEIGTRLVEAFTTATDEGGVDEIHIVSTKFVNMVTQTPSVLRLLPLEVVEGVEAPPEHEILPLYAFEPDAEQVLDALLPRYVSARIYNALLQAAASEHAARQRAMKAAGDNADDLIKNFTRLANQARQAEITQEITEIVSGADALTSAR